jgi:ketopantoate reductase
MVGAGGVGAIAALNLQVGGKASVTVVLRSTYNIVSSKGFKIDSIDHGVLSSWKPHTGLYTCLLHLSLTLVSYTVLISQDSEHDAKTAS